MSAAEALSEFERLVTAHQRDAGRSALKDFGSVVAARAAERTLLSGATIRKLSDVAGEHLEKYADTLVAMAEQFSQQFSIASEELFGLMQVSVTQLPLIMLEADVIKNLEAKMGKPSVRLEVLKLLRPYQDRTSLKLSKFKIGLRNQVGVVTQTVSNTINTQNLNAANIQMGVRNTAQDVRQTIDYSQLETVINEIESTLPKMDVDENVVADLCEDIATIKSQLKKRVPSSTIIGEAAKSLRNILEGGVGGALAAYVPIWLQTLSTYYQ